MNDVQNIFSTLVQAEILAFSFQTARISGALITAPLPWAHAPVRFRAALAIALGLVAHGASRAAPEVINGAPLALALAGFSELMLGAAIGFVVRLTVAVAEIMASAISPSIGLGAAEIFSPGFGNENLLGQFLRLFAISGALILGVHRQLLGSLLSSFRVIPPGTLLNPAPLGPVLLELTSGAIETGVRLSLPILAVLFVIQLALAFISRAAPAMQIFSVGFAVTIISGMAVIVIFLPELSQDLLGDASHVPDRIGQILRAVVR
ncbi:MAG: flagellar biosynthetic protein FliR [Polyangiaceae bacterium]|nr:flagellar biosynthetic protein FliR [Polyangiaceae bacterium]